MELHIGCMVIANCAGTAQSGPGEYCREREYPFYLLSDRILSSWSLALVTVVGRGIFGTGCLIPNRTLCRGLSRTRDHCGCIRRRINRAAPHWFSSSLAPLPPDASSSSSFCSSSVPGLLGKTDRRSFVHPSQPDLRYIFTRVFSPFLPYAEQCRISVTFPYHILRRIN